MKVSIITEAGRGIGFGHLSRCIGLYQALEEKGAYPELIINGDETIGEFLYKRRYRILNWLKRADEVLALAKSAHWVIIDSYLAQKSFYNEISRLLRAKVVMIDDYNRIAYPDGIVVNPSVYGDRVAYPDKKGIRYLTGEKYIILRKVFWEIPEKKINKEIRDVLVTFGGISHSHFAQKLASYLKDKFGVAIHIIDPQLNTIDDKSLLRMMLEVDICIAGGGQTTYELARAGVPTIAICFADNQKMNLETWQSKKVMEYADTSNQELLLSDIERMFVRLLSYRERAGRSGRGKACVDGKGAIRIAEVMLKKGNDVTCAKNEQRSAYCA